MNRYSLLLIVFTCLFSCRESDSEKEIEEVKTQSYSGAGYVTGLMNPDSDVFFIVEVDQSGKYLLEIRYRNAGTIGGTALLIINDMLTENYLESMVQTNTESWQTAKTEVFLQNGTNSIIIRNSKTTRGLSELDYIEIKKKQ